MILKITVILFLLFGLYLIYRSCINSMKERYVDELDLIIDGLRTTCITLRWSSPLNWPEHHHQKIEDLIVLMRFAQKVITRLSGMKKIDEEPLKSRLTNLKELHKELQQQVEEILTTPVSYTKHSN